MAIYKLAGFEPDSPVGIGKLVKSILGTSVEAKPNLRAKAQISRIGDVWRIYVRKGLTIERMRFEVGHELSHHRF